jgi:hypothetical protein
VCAVVTQFSRDAAVAAVAGAQKTIVSHAQLLERGCTRRVIAHWVNRGRLRVVFPCVSFAVSCRPWRGSRRLLGNRIRSRIRSPTEDAHDTLT